MADTEHLHFKIELSGTYWEKHPQYSIAIDDNIVSTGTITAESDVAVIVEFDADIAEGPHSLKIRLENKDHTDTVQSEDKTSIVKDMLLNIKSIEIDEINIGPLLWSASSFTGDDADRPVLENCVNLGWNGTWCLPFTSPFYIWLLENI
jgi:hypothetical protein